MKGQTVGNSPAPMTPNTPKDIKKSRGAGVNWYNNIAETTASKVSNFFGRAVAGLTSVVAFIPALAINLGHAVINLYDRKISRSATAEQNPISSTDLSASASNSASASSSPSTRNVTPTQNQEPTSNVPASVVNVVNKVPEKPSCSPKVAEQAPTPNLPIIQGAKVQWRRYIHDDDVRATMASYDQFFAKNITHRPEDIPKAAYRKLRREVIPIDLITQNSHTTVELTKKLGGGGSKSFYDIGDNQALAIIAAPHQPYDELMMLRYLEKLGIPTNEIQPAVIGWEHQGVKYTMATYTAPSFNSYMEQNIFVLDRKKDIEVIERLDGRKILSEDQDPFSVANWDKVLEPLVHDIRTMVDNGVNTQGDALNSILVGKGSKFHSGSDADYEVRAFPFDFSSKSVEYTQLPVKKQLSLEAEEKMLRAYIGEIIFIQFASEERPQAKKKTALIESLTERHLRKRTVLQKV